MSKSSKSLNAIPIYRPRFDALIDALIDASMGALIDALIDAHTHHATRTTQSPIQLLGPETILDWQRDDDWTDAKFERRTGQTHSVELEHLLIIIM
jgi:hypothetical protein